jgi:metal-responsive CopG/Arc/MetJ family transcriptional regulator
MRAKKIAISVPPDVLDDVDRAARRRATTRSGFITELLRIAASASRDADVERRIRAFFADEVVAKDSRKDARTLSRVASGLPDWEW